MINLTIAYHVPVERSFKPLEFLIDILNVLSNLWYCENVSCYFRLKVILDLFILTSFVDKSWRFYRAMVTEKVFLANVARASC